MWSAALKEGEAPQSSLANAPLLPPDSPGTDPEVRRRMSAPTPNTGVKSHALRVGPRPTDDVARGLAWQFSALLPPAGAPLDPPAIVARAQTLEDQAFRVLEVLTPQKVGAAESELRRWFDGVETRALRGERLDALEHLTLLHTLREGLLDRHSSLAELRPRFLQVLADSDRAYTGRTRAVGEILEKGLPRRVIRGESKDAQKVQAAILGGQGSGPVAALRSLVHEGALEAGAPIAAVALLAALFSSTGAELLGGAIHGYLLGSLVEHVLHRYLGHASTKEMERIGGILERFGPIGRGVREWLETTRFSHAVIHHGAYGGSYVDRFAPRDTSLPKEEIDRRRSEKQASLTAKAAARGEADLRQLERSDYGVKLADAVEVALYTAPVTALVTAFSSAIAQGLGADLGGLFLTSSVLASLLYVPASNLLHPFLHMTKEEALAKAGPLMRRFLESGYVSHIARAHYVHHRDAQVNQNLIAGADYLLGYKPSNVEVLVALRKLGTFY